MRDDQRRRNNGQFGFSEHHTGGGGLTDASLDGDQLEVLVACRVAPGTSRAFDILFDQNRKLWGWSTKSDMYRDALERGLREIHKGLRVPNTELDMLLEEADQLEANKNMARRHANHQKSMVSTMECLQVLRANNDMAGMRKTLTEFYERTARLKDPVIAARRREEARQQGWDVMLEKLNRGVSLRPVDQDEDDEV